MDASTIAAIATPRGNGGIGIVRISGTLALGIAQRIFLPARRSRHDGVDDEEAGLKSHRLYYGHICDPGSGRIVDEVLVNVMRSPRSYTREDVVEICAHGGASVLEMILGLVMEHGAKLAEPGEFTRRAFLNGRIDLTQAEAVIDLINAQSRRARQIAANQVAGKLRDTLEGLQSALTDIYARIEAGIDFPEDMEDEGAEQGLMRERLLSLVIRPLKRLCEHHEDARLMREGLTALILGRPNVGKSSLLNRLLQRDRAIVSATPGTTRDFIEDSFQFKGTAVTVIDTAGMQKTADPVEKLGIAKTRELVQRADVVLLVLEATSDIGAAEHEIFSLVSRQKVILVQNKCDLAGKAGPVALPAEWRDTPQVRISAKTGEGIEALKETVERICLSTDEAVFEGAVVANRRQAGLLKEALDLACQAQGLLDREMPAELAVIDLKGALSAVAQCLGNSVAQDVLDEIFNRFCIGK